MTPRAASGPPGRLSALSNELKALRERLRAGGGANRIDAQHEAGKLTARERIGLLLDPGEPTFEIGLLLGHDVEEEPVPAAVVTCVGRVHGRETVIVASDATVEGGAWRPTTVSKILRAQEVAMRCRIPVVYLMDTEAPQVPVLGEVFPGQYGAGRALYYAAVMRHHLGNAQFAGVMGACSGSAALLPALADVIVMVDGTSFLGLGGPELVRAATGRAIESDDLGGSIAQVDVSGVAHYRVASDPSCIELLRDQVGALPSPAQGGPDRIATPPVRLSYELYDLIPDDHRQPYDVHAVLECLLDGEPLEEFQPEHAPEMICGTAFLDGVHVGVVANARGLFRSGHDHQPRLGGLVYAESARKTAYFIETMNRQGAPILFVQDVAGFMVGPEAEHEAIIRAGAELVEAMATARVPKIVLTLIHASGAGYYAMAGQGFDPDFTVALPTGRWGLEDSGHAGTGIVEALRAAAGGFVDEILLPEELRPALGLLLRSALHNAGPHLGPFQLV